MISHCPVVFAGVAKSLAFSTTVFNGVGLCAGPPETVEQIMKIEDFFWWGGALQIHQVISIYATSFTLKDVTDHFLIMACTIARCSKYKIKFDID